MLWTAAARAIGRRRGCIVDKTIATPDVHAYLPLVATIARVMSRGLPSAVELSELINDGVIGLIAAVRKYDPGRGVAFSTYAGHRIRGAMIDGLRRRDPLPRSLRRAQKARWPPRAQAAEPRAESYPDRRGRGWGRESGVHLVELDHALAVPADEGDGPEARAIDADLRRQLCRGLWALPERDRDVLVMRFLQELPLREVAARLSLSITRIVEIQTRGLIRLRRFLTGEPIRHPRRTRVVRQEPTFASTNRPTASTGMLSIPPPTPQAE
jgi:RNA polymerase sigma factor for flagellar operon FliA